MKAVLMSIRPKWCIRILYHGKNVEIRRNRPNLAPPFKVFMYCSKGRGTLLDIIKDGDSNYGEIYHGPPVFIKATEEGGVYLDRQRIVGEFNCDRIVRTSEDTLAEQIKSGDLSGFSTGMTVKDFNKLLRKGPLFLWHISDYKEYERPKLLSEFGLTRPPQSWQYVEVSDGDG